LKGFGNAKDLVSLMIAVALAFGTYFAFLMGLFFWTRAHTWTEAEALPEPNKKPGFGPKISLGNAAVGMFQHGGPRVLAAICIASLIARLSFIQVAWIDLWVLVGVLAFWPFQEWLIHAWLEHLKPIRWGRRELELVITKTHRAHHRNPWNPKYGLTTTYFVVLFAGGVPMLWGLNYQIGMPLHAALTGNLVTFLLILNYEWIHYLIHTSYVPRTQFYRRLWKNHRLHHFQNENYWFGLTMLSGDRVLGTQPGRDKAAHSQTVMNLGVDAVQE
jgi:hypothetical protein